MSSSLPRPTRSSHRMSPTSLQEALVELRFGVDAGCRGGGDLKVGDSWDLGEGLGIVLLSLPTSRSSRAFTR